MEIIVFCVTLTSIMAVLLVGIGVTIGRNDKGESNGDIDNRVYVHCGDRNRRSNIGHDKPEKITDEEMRSVLEYYRIGATIYEKKVIDAMLERLDNPLGYCPHQE